MLDSVPEEFKSFATELAFSMMIQPSASGVAFKIVHWNTGKISYPDGDDPDGSASMLAILDSNPNTYKAWAEDYYERPISLSAVEKIYGQVPITPELVQELNTTADFESVVSDAAEIDYPVART